MTKTDTQPEALRLAAWLNEGCWHQMRLGDVEAAGRELRRQHATIAALTAENAAQAQQIAQDRADAARWRHVRDEPYTEEVARVMRYQLNAAMDQAVDAAIAMKEKTP